MPDKGVLESGDPSGSPACRGGTYRCTAALVGVLVVLAGCGGDDDRAQPVPPPDVTATGPAAAPPVGSPAKQSTGAPPPPTATAPAPKTAAKTPPASRTTRAPAPKQRSRTESPGPRRPVTTEPEALGDSGSLSPSP